jgi:hypothetical protein
MEIARNIDGSIKNSHGKFEPLVNIATVLPAQFQEASSTNDVTLVIQKNEQTKQPEVITIFPGENAPGIPALINSANYQSNTLHDPGAIDYWNNHAFIKMAA